MGERHVIEEILDDKVEEDEIFYLVKWVGYTNRHNAWISENDLDADFLLPQYLKRKENKIFEEFDEENQINEKGEFFEKISELLDWTQKCSEQINLSCDTSASTKEALRRNSELRKQIDGKQFEFGYVEELGQRLIEKGYPKEQVKINRKLKELKNVMNELEGFWEKREDKCRQLLEMEEFTSEADSINSLNKEQLAFLAISSKSDSLEKVQNLLKEQTEFEAKLSAKEERVLLFVASADRLIRTGHSQSAQIENQKREVIYGHQGVIERTQLRRAQLERGLALEGLRRDASVLDFWINEKRHQMEQQIEVGGVGALNWAQTRHQAFMLELAANRAELSRLAKSGAALIRDGVAEREAVANVLEPLEVELTKLETLAQQRGDLLDQEKENLPQGQVKKKRTRNNASLIN
ncbi:unnamed protein product [Meloidogyne enterolobii]|uniref:Uncharacterized protein n=1 Tax=Meloidogyne enterolobii TaxID=390850 RepID=A0ACB0YG72_MELEN